MKTAGVTLHLCQKIAVTCTIAFVAIFLLLTTVVSISITADLVQLNSLLQSDYVYSATTSSVTADGAYYQYQSGITFSPAEDAKGGINAEVVMQTADSHYTDLVYWNTHRLEQDGVAISANIANENCLEVGDTMFSKNIIDGAIHEYTVEAILPAVTYTRGLNDGFHNEGIIVMGFDDQYASSITHSCIVYTKESIEALASQCSSMPEDILYRDDEIGSIIKNTAPYLSVYILVAAVCMFCFVIILAKDVSHNYRRQIILGFEKRAMNNAYYSTIGKTVLPVIGVTAVISGTAFTCSGICIAAFAPAICVTVVELAALFISAAVINGRLWRK